MSVNAAVCPNVVYVCLPACASTVSRQV